jgi:hypothetical protein
VFDLKAILRITAVSRDQDDMRSLDYLRRASALRVTSLSLHGRLLLRVYLLPHDSELRNSKVMRNSPKQSHMLPRMCTLLRLVVRGTNIWAGADADETLEYFIPRKEVRTNSALVIMHLRILFQDSRLLAEIYGDLESPSVQVHTDVQHPDGDVIRQIIEGEPVLGLRTDLYSYQRRTVAAMVARELDSRPAPDPLCLSLSCVDGRTVYWQPTRMEFYREQPVVHQTRGGILCEELDTGDGYQGGLQENAN